MEKRTKTIGISVLILLLVGCIVSAGAAVVTPVANEDATHIQVHSWDELKNAIENDDGFNVRIIEVMNDIEADNQVSSINVARGKDIIIMPTSKAGDIKIISNESRLSYPFFKINGGELTILGNSATTLTLTGVNSMNAVFGSAVCVNDGTFTMNDGAKITNCSGQESNSFGGAVYISKCGTFNMNGGTISNCNVNSFGYGGAVCNDEGTFNMKGGVISNCSAGVNGGAVENYGRFNMKGGVITDCKVGGLGAAVNNDYGGVFNMTGGIIEKCYTQTFGNNYVLDKDNIVSTADGTFNNNGGTIIC